MVGKQGDCFASSAQAQAAVQAQSVAIGANGQAIASASSSTNAAMTSCMAIGSDVNTWRLFHNPDPMQFSGGEFHMDASSVIDVTTSDIVFAQVSRAYALASSWSGAASASASASVGYNSGSFGGYAWSMSGGKNLLISQPVQQPVQPQQPVVTQVTNNPVLNQPVSNASASASASAVAGNVVSAEAEAQTTPNNNFWGSFNWSPFFKN